MSRQRLYKAIESICPNIGADQSLWVWQTFFLFFSLCNRKLRLLKIFSLFSLGHISSVSCYILAIHKPFQNKYSVAITKSFMLPKLIKNVFSRVPPLVLECVCVFDLSVGNLRFLFWGSSEKRCSQRCSTCLLLCLALLSLLPCLSDPQDCSSSEEYTVAAALLPLSTAFYRVRKFL